MAITTENRDGVSEMAHRILNMLAVASFTGIPSAAFAFVAEPPVAIPEPSSITLVAAGLGTGLGVYIIRRWMRRK